MAIFKPGVNRVAGTVFLTGFAAGFLLVFVRINLVQYGEAALWMGLVSALSFLVAAIATVKIAIDGASAANAILPGIIALASCGYIALSGLDLADGARTTVSGKAITATVAKNFGPRIQIQGSDSIYNSLFGYSISKSDSSRISTGTPVSMKVFGYTGTVSTIRYGK